MSLDDSIREMVRSELRSALADMFQEDRRQAPRTKGSNGVSQRAKRTCPVAGCKNPFAPRYGGFCTKHHNTAGYKEWLASKGKKAAKKR